jgi:hypothetical protein
MADLRRGKSLLEVATCVAKSKPRQLVAHRIARLPGRFRQKPFLLQLCNDAFNQLFRRFTTSQTRMNEIAAEGLFKNEGEDEADAPIYKGYDFLQNLKESAVSP